MAGLAVRQAGGVQRGAGAAAVFEAGFLAEGQVEEVQVAQRCLLGALGQGGRVGGDAGQAQPGGVRADAGGDQLAHQNGFLSSSRRSSSLARIAHDSTAL